MKRTLSIAVLAGFCGTASAMTGNEFLDLHQRNDYAALNYLIGVSESADLFALLAATANKTAPPKFRGCPDPSVTFGQLRDVAVKDLRDNPKDRHLDAPYLLIRSWMAAWPCK